MRDYRCRLESEVARRTGELQRAIAQLKAASLDTVNRLSAAAECKDEETGSHILRMSHYAALLARAIGFDHETILYAAPMHDIGKIGVPDQILLKADRLDPVEWEIMKQHTTIGARILSGSDSEFIRMAERIALTHHERWDGTGYPGNLRGPEIPLEGRIAAAADVFDALTSRRPYRQTPYDVDAAFRIMKQGRETHFDPGVLDAFLAHRDQIEAVKSRYDDKESSLFVRLTAAAGGGSPRPPVESRGGRTRPGGAP
jgi:putative two-component system response regulator